jgi:ketosteroid isomerase-like protein
VDSENKPGLGSSAAGKPGVPSSDLAMDEFFTRLQSDMRRPDLSQEAVAAAFQAIQKLALESDSEEGTSIAAPEVSTAASGTGTTCRACQAAIAAGSKFCSVCGVPAGTASPEAAMKISDFAPAAPGPHYYHHHYHHHYFQAAGAPLGTTEAEARPSGVVPARDAVKARTPSGAPSMSRAEVTVRKMTQDWAQACNTKHLDDLVDLYASDGLVLRSNLPPIRGTSAIREFFFGALDAGLGDAEFESLRVELFGDIAYEAGRCKVLTPLIGGKRREERGKYVLLYAKQSTGEWKVIVDCWSSDLSLAVAPEAAAKLATPNSAVPLVRGPRKGV